MSGIVKVRHTGRRPSSRNSLSKISTKLDQLPMLLLSPALPRLSSATLYAAHAMIEIAEADGHVVNAAAIVEHQRLPAHFLDQLLGRLRRAGLVRSVRGPHGGYALARPPTAITLAHIVTAIEPSFESLDWAKREDHVDAPDHDASGCAVVEAWRSAGNAMQAAMQHTSLAALVHRKRELEQPQVVRARHTPRQSPQFASHASLGQG